MTQRLRLFILFFLFAFLTTANAQKQFITLDWNELPAVETLPEIFEEIELPADFRNFEYAVNLEFPEYEALSAEDAEKLDSINMLFPTTPELHTWVSVVAGKAKLNVRFLPFVSRNKSLQRLNSFKLSLVSTPVSAVATRAAITRMPDTSVLAEGRIVKIRVADSGVFQITNAELRRMGFTNPDNVGLYGYGGHLLSNSFTQHPCDDLPEVPMYRTGDGVLFYGRGPVYWSWSSANQTYGRTQNCYSQYAYYFLIDNGNIPAEFPVETSPAVDGSTQLNTFDAYALYERDAYNWLKSGRDMYDSYDYANGNMQDYNFRLTDIIEEDARITVAFSARSTSSATTINIAANGESLGNRTVPSTGNDYYVKATETVGTLLWNGSKAENTTVRITHNRNSGISGRLNYIAINYTQQLRLRNGYLAFRAQASVGRATTFTLSGANSSTVIWDVTSPDGFKQINGTLNGDTYTFTIPAGSTLREFVAVNTAYTTFSSVDNIGSLSNQNLRGMEPVDMVIIVPDRSVLITQAERLASAHRTMDSLRVAVIPAPQIYNEFSSGTPDATAYRRLMKMLYDRAANEDELPRYLLLFGDCAYDNRMLSSAWSGYSPSDFLLSYQVASSTDEKSSYLTDDYFGFLEDGSGSSLSSDKLCIAVGRLPVRTADEAKIVVDKNITYMENQNAGTWKRTVCFVADDAEGSNSDNVFMQHAIDLADSVQLYAPYVRAERILADAFKREASSTGYTYPDATRRLMQLFDQGMLMVNYTGHSGTVSWSEEQLLNTDHINKMNSDKLPVWFTASCEFTRFDDTATSGGEMALLHPKGGAIALFSTSRVVYDTQNYHFHRAVINSMFKQSAGKRVTLGDIFKQAKQGTRYLQTDANKLNFNLTGNPALRLTIPEYQVEIEEVDGLSVGSDLPLMQAGSKVTVKGRITDIDGQPVEDFDGTIHPLVLDNKERVYTLDNIGEGAVYYDDHIRTLFSGMDSIRNGSFEFTFPVPLDINYSDQQGLMKFYACSSDKREAGGDYNRFGVGGTADDLVIGGDGPEMLLYLNTPDFEWGGKVNETPYFVAELEDPDGINTVGNGIGHDLSLCIDGKTTYNLNDYYIPQAGDYTRGRVTFSIPELSEGKHTLTFRAWDLLNQSTTKSLEFEVVKGLRPELFSITCSNSPARENTTFILSHDRPDSELDIRITVLDYTGRELWVHTETGVSSGNYYYIDWDLCSNGGQRLWPGVYLYRAAIVSGASKESTKTEKIVILSQ